MSPLDNRPIASYVTLTFVFSWIAWATSSLFEAQAISFVFVILGGFGPMVGALAMVRQSGEQSLRAWLRAQLQFRGPIRWYALAVMIPLVFPLVLTGYLASQGTPIDPSFLLERGPLYLGSLVFVFFLGGGQEEFGWRGYLLPELLQRTDTLRANIVIGLVWGCWHLPLYVIPGQLYASKPFSSYLLLVVALTFVFTWLHEAAGRRLPVVMLLHAGVNSTGALVPVQPAFLESFQSSHEATLVMFAATIIVVAALRVQTSGWRPGTGQANGEREVF